MRAAFCSVFLGSIALFGACESTKPSEHAVAPAPSDAAAVALPVVAPRDSASARENKVDASVSAPRWPKIVAAWTDKEAVERLESDCRAEISTRDPDGDIAPLSCKLPFDQSCAYDPCFAKHSDCRGACGKTCESCDATCTSSCDSCKTKCKDDECRHACAKTTGQCKDACLKTLDHCASGDCVTPAKDCYAREKQTWRAHGCSCKKIQPCTEACIGTQDACDGSDCVGACFDRCGRKFPGCDVRYCVMGSEPGSP